MQNLYVNIYVYVTYRFYGDLPVVNICVYICNINKENLHVKIYVRISLQIHYEEEALVICDPMHRNTEVLGLLEARQVTHTHTRTHTHTHRERERERDEPA